MYALFPNHTPLTAWLARWFLIVLMLPNAYSHWLFTVTVSDMKSRSAYALCVWWWWWWWSAHAFMCVMVVVVVCVYESVCLCLCLCAWSRWFLLQSPEMKLAFLLQFISRWKHLPVMWLGPSHDVEQRWRQTSVRQYLISNIRKTSLIWYRILKHIWLII